ncbi:MAG TPA: TOMM precursor leader peptide-binding protein [Solirubrobacteraceae bacterium]
MLKPWYRRVLRDDTALFEYADVIVRMDGAAVRQLFPRIFEHLDGTHALEEVINSCGEEAAPATLNALKELSKHGLLMEGSVGPTIGEPENGDVALHDVVRRQETIRFLTATAPFEAASPAESLPNLRLAVVGSGDTADEVLRLFRESSVLAVRGDWEASSGEDHLYVVAPAPDELPLLEIWNAAAFERKQSWVQVLPYNGRFAAVGPLYVPGETCCYACFLVRRAQNSGYASEFGILQRSPARYPMSPAMSALLASAACNLVLAWAIDPATRLAGTLHSVEFGRELIVQPHSVYRAPRCPVCSPLARRGQPAVLAEQ